MGGGERGGVWGGDGGRAKGAILFPAFLAGNRTMGDDIVGGRLDVLGVISVISDTQFPGQDDWESLLIHLDAVPIGRTIDITILREMSISLLLAVKGPEQGTPGIGRVSGDDEGTGELLHIAFPDQVIATCVTITLRATPANAQPTYQLPTLLLLGAFHRITCHTSSFLSRLSTP